MLHYELVKKRGCPLYECLYECLREDILRGRLLPGTKLPSRRELAGFTTANRVPTKGLRREEEELRTLTAIPEETINRAFLAAAEAEEEAILNSMAAAGETRGLKGEYYRSLSDILSQEGEIH